MEQRLKHPNENHFHSGILYIANLYPLFFLIKLLEGMIQFQDGVKQERAAHTT